MEKEAINKAIELATGGIRNACNDLNAMHEAAMQLRISSPLKYIHYTAAITAIVAKHNSDLEDSYSISTHDASATQRAEAFLRTLNLWEEE